MKTTIKKAVLTLLAAGTLTFGNAQKIAHIDLDSLSGIMPETKVAKGVAENYLSDLKKTVGAMEEEFQKKYNDYLQNEPTLSPLVKKTKEEELQSLQTRIQEFNQQAQTEYQKKSAELTAPIMEKAKKAIEAVAKEGGYKYVLDTSNGSILYSEPGEDILVLVKKKLDTMPAAVIPGTNGNPEKPKTNPAPPKGGK
ncbi:MAG TPA: OmpH family outer membrane protein [Bacteroidia bacterium]|jgi:outer membrane protein|nr:OmpH family outer membrane protein [Bacteroidia bacterium]